MNPSEKIAVLRVERRALASGKPHPRNPRTHPPQGSPEWETMRASLAFDYFDPLILNERNGMWVAGHFRQKVMIADGFTHADMVIVDYDDATHLARMKTTVFRSVEARLSSIARLVVTRSHAKVICLPTSAGDHYVIEGSANLRSSDNIEQMLITNDPATHAFHAAWLDDLAAQ